MSRKQSTQRDEQLQKLLNDYVDDANHWAHFSQRHTRLTARAFVQLVVLGWLKNKTASLNELAQSAHQLGIPLTGAALHERMDHRAVVLLASVLKLALSRLHTACPLPIPLLARFRAIYVTDSTQLALPQALYPLFPGNKTNSSVKLQVTWDYLQGNLAAIELEAGRTPDQACQLHVSHAQAGTLQLFDLGYFKQEYLSQIDAQEAFFVSRYQSQTALYDPTTREAFCLVTWLTALVQPQAEIDVRLGSRAQLRVRLVARRLSVQAADARRRKARLKAKKQGRTCSATYLFLLGWDLLVTNLPTDLWSLEQIFDLYPIRFQIEWLFRIWKDQIGLDELGAWRVERVLCQLYAHLLGALLCHVLAGPWRWAEHEYSFLKVVQIIQATLSDLLRCFARQGWGLKAWLIRLDRAFDVLGRKSKRRKTLSTLQRLYNWGLS